jgi:Spy/CpxP family protein refolding chaperone
MRTWKMLGFGLIIATLWVAPGWAQARGGRHGDVLGFGHLLRALNLTETQQAQVHDAFATFRATVQPLRGQVRAAQQQLTDLLLSPSALDTTALQTAEQQLASLHDDLLQARLTLAKVIRAVLTSDQLTQATQLKEQLRTLETTRRQLLAPQAQP